ncbi:MAG TPA: TspO/MBR family protein [Burkholderiales bacterium]|nr:TspO/MBR family protein [Burkholderiales bacterium]
MTRDLASLAVFVALAFAVAAAGGALSATSVHGWYQGLAKPAFNPPDWLFAPVWGVLYLMVALAGWRLWRRRAAAGRGAALRWWGLQLGFNLAWSLVFFGARLPGAALADMVLLLGAIGVAILLAARVDRAAAWLLAPYLAWVAFAALLNAAIWYLN